MSAVSGLASKNGILIVEFAEQLGDKGLSVTDAAVQAAKIRLRPILMTSFAGTTAFGGMIVSTVLNLFSSRCFT